MKRISIFSLTLLALYGCQPAQNVKNTDTVETNDANAPLHLLKPDYPVRYGETTIDSIKLDMDKVYGYLQRVTPAILENKGTGEELRDVEQIDTATIFRKGDFRLVSYEWGVTYGAMLRATEVTKDAKYAAYSSSRMDFILDALPKFRALEAENPGYRSPLHSVIHPEALDDAGAMCAALIKVQQAGLLKREAKAVIDNYINYIVNKEFRLKDGTLARNRPQPNTLWLDDLYMSLPALAQMGQLTGDAKYTEEAIKQFWLFTDKMFVKEKGLYRHGWVQDMDPHPAFHWARANGWALLTKVELLQVLPEQHPARAALLEQFKKHVAGLAPLQHGTGFWHQLLDKNDSYLETSATAIYAYCIAHGINAGWLDAKAYGPMVLQAWNAVHTKINADGQVEGTCVGTGMGFDPAFYYYRPVNKFAAHGYGPVLLAAAEVYALLNTKKYVINDSSVQF
ncbi:glycoside hydrolase family 88/105 protein [Sphingobacterium bambusae]|uniref:Glycoside hydrolase family 105 protein n=1 Tax=Sphingobacterium bambusae TaxID=662858 RepID=A0ABW6BED8_9SPHI|nr:glycoside hydrolase family 88 protein [Sphingobacterium bambusae]WPL50554.1 glycoside hydrolase family 88 protein [Sphingobacterium bambusae]